MFKMRESVRYGAILFVSVAGLVLSQWAAAIDLA